MHELNTQFKIITPVLPLRHLPEEVVHDLSSDQQYAYRMAVMITTGVIDVDLLSYQVGIVCHARWLTTANRICRLYVSKHGLTGNDSKKLRAITHFIINHYFLMWFEIKCSPTLKSGPLHVFHEIKIIQGLNYFYLFRKFQAVTM